MRITVPKDKWKLFEKLPRTDRKPFAEIAAVQTFKLIGWATVVAGMYLLQSRTHSAVFLVLPYVLWLFIVWDMTAKLGWEPEVERTEQTLHVNLPKLYWLKLAWIGLFSGFVAWAVVFWLSPLILKHGLASL